MGPVQGYEKTFFGFALGGELSDLVGDKNISPRVATAATLELGQLARISRPIGRRLKSRLYVTEMANSTTAERQNRKTHGGFDYTLPVLCARGMLTHDIQSFLHEKYAIDVSPVIISSVTESVSANVLEGSTQHMSPNWPIHYLDSLLLKVLEEGRGVTKAFNK